MDKPLIEISGIAKSFGKSEVLSNFSLSVTNGEFITLLGPSGCGKTTVLRIIGGFETPDSGEIVIKGEKVNNIPPNKRNVNTVFQSYALFPHMTVFDNVAFGLKMEKVNKAEIKERVAEAINIVKLADFMERKPHQLSGGQQQRVAIARAIVKKPAVLLLDEPFSALDYKLRKEMQIELKSLQRKLGITFIFVTHDQEEALSMSDRVVVMNKGDIEQIGTPKDVYESPSNLFVAGFVGETNIFDGVVESYSNGYANILIEKSLFSLKTKEPYPSGTKLKIVLRPEDLRVYTIKENSETNNFIYGFVEETNYKGATLDSRILTDTGKTVLASEFFDEDDEYFEYKHGEKVGITWVPGWENIFKDE